MPRNIDDLFSPVSEGTRFSVRAKPRSRSFRIAISDQIVIHCKNPPERGRANREILKQLSKLLNRRVRIVSGYNSRSKILLAESIKPEEVKEILLANQSESLA